MGTALQTPVPAQVVAAIAGQPIAPGSVAISGAASAAPLFSVTNTQAGPAVPFVQFNAANAADLVSGVQVTGDTVERMSIDATGTHRFSPGNSAADVVTKRSGANTMQQTLGNLDIAGNGAGLAVKESANGKQGTAVLVAGTATVANTSVTANSRIFLTSQADGGTPGFLRVTAKTAGVSFVITSSNAADTSTVAYEIFEPG